MHGGRKNVSSVAFRERNHAPLSGDNKGVEVTRPDGTRATFWAPTWAEAQDKAEDDLANYKE